MFFVFYITSYIQYYSSYIKVLNHLHRNKRHQFFTSLTNQKRVQENKSQLFKICFSHISKATLCYHYLKFKLKRYPNSTSAAAVDPAFKKRSCKLRFSKSLLCYEQNLPTSDVNYVNKEY